MWEVDKDLFKVGAAAAVGTAIVFGIAKVGNWLIDKASSSKDDKKDEKK